MLQKRNAHTQDNTEQVQWKDKHRKWSTRQRAKLSVDKNKYRQSERKTGSERISQGDRQVPY